MAKEELEILLGGFTPTNRSALPASFLAHNYVFTQGWSFSLLE